MLKGIYWKISDMEYGHRIMLMQREFKDIMYV